MTLFKDLFISLGIQDISMDSRKHKGIQPSLSSAIPKRFWSTENADNRRFEAVRSIFHSECDEIQSSEQILGGLVHEANIARSGHERIRKRIRAKSREMPSRTMPRAQTTQRSSHTLMFYSYVRTIDYV